MLKDNILHAQGRTHCQKLFETGNLLTSKLMFLPDTDIIFLKGVLTVDFLEHKQIIWENLSFSNKIGNILLLKLLKEMEVKRCK